MRTVTVIYEDSGARGVLVRDFGPHALLLACLAEDLATDPHALARQVVAHPANGNDKALRKLADDRLFPVVALVDDDKIRRLLELAADACKRDVLLQVESTYGRPLGPDVVLVLLHRNIESIVEAACVALGEPTPPKSPEARDRVLRKAAAADKAVRAAIRAACGGTFERLLKKVITLISASESPPAAS